MKNQPVMLIVVAVVSVTITVFVLHWYGYLRHSTEQDSVYLAEFNLIKNIPGQEQFLSHKPAPFLAYCAGGYLVMSHQKRPGVAGVLTYKNKQPIPCKPNQ
ncbi:hypothetical protein [Spartinivicinus poritis]|uniref:Uncharacterized protein n=1 Tax=Spartinivicinus poritis TaxID=2994640 RepID=A0ABT5U271_9GAMM|nr:hypothetical protein [Spartinivicinus sp. A2-2]MDE1460461.1 hypothetical protein [Spartinivicinus sp. A2-2]